MCSAPLFSGIKTCSYVSVTNEDSFFYPYNKKIYAFLLIPPTKQGHVAKKIRNKEYTCTKMISFSKLKVRFMCTI